MYSVYVLRSEKDGLIYIGQTNDLKLRILRHQKGYVKSTRNRRPLKLIYFEEYRDRGTAMRREKFLKSGAGHNLLNSKLGRRGP